MDMDIDLDLGPDPEVEQPSQPVLPVSDQARP